MTHTPTAERKISADQHRGNSLIVERNVDHVNRQAGLLVNCMGTLRWLPGVEGWVADGI